MKRFLAAILVVCIMLNTILVMSASAFDKYESEIQKFIDDSLSLINQAPEIIKEAVANNGAIQSEEDINTYSEFETCRLIVESEKKPDKLDSIGIASGFMDYHIIQFANERDAEKAFEHYSKRKDITSVYPDEIISLSKFETDGLVTSVQAEVPKRLNSWGADAIGLYDLNDYLIDNNIPMNEVVVGVVDTGVDLEHEFLQGRLIETGFNASGLGEINSEMDKDKGHGTMVSSVIVDSTPENVKVAVYKILTVGGEYLDTSMTAATLGILQAVEDDVDVINTSFSIPDKKGMISDAVRLAYNNNIPVVASAGNNSSYMAMADTFPAEETCSITVASNSKNNVFSSFSNYGGYVDVAAPGEDVLVADINNTYREALGTSFSAPFVASVCVLLKAINSDYSAEDIIERIKETATPYDEILETSDHMYRLHGAGIIDALGAIGIERQAVVKANLNPGDYYESINVELSSEGSDEIYYTLDQTTPTRENGILYTEPIEITDDCVVVKAIAYNKGKPRSEVFSGFYKSWKNEFEQYFTTDETGKILSYSGDSRFLVIPEAINGITVTDIADGVFDESKVVGVTLPKGVEKLTGGFEENRNIMYIRGENVKEIGDYVFSNVGKMHLIDFPGLEKAGDETFRGITAMMKVVFPKLKYVGYKCFAKSSFMDLRLPELERCGTVTFHDSWIFGLYVPKLKAVDEPEVSWYETGPFRESSVIYPLDLPSIEHVNDNFFAVSDYDRNTYTCRVEFSNLKELEQAPRVKTLTLILPATIESITAPVDYYLENATVKIYGTSGTLAEAWAKENNFEFIEITSETAVITDLPEYYKSYMRELVADVVGFNREYQWYSNTTDSSEGGTPIEGATSKKFNPSDYPAPYYYCEVTSTDKGYDPIVIKTSVCENRSIEFADYSNLEKALTKVPENLSIYTSKSRQQLEGLIEKAESNEILSQNEVDELAEKIETAIVALELITVVLSKNEITLRYKEICSISAESETVITWYSTNSKVAIVDQNGNIIAMGRGVAEIIAEIENGEKAICTVAVKFTWWQWLIYIFFFGWIWY